MSGEQWCWTIPGPISPVGPYSTRELALAAGRAALGPGSRVSTGRVINPTIADFCDGLTLLHSLNERAEEAGGKRWLSSTPDDALADLAASVSTVLEEWAERHHLQPRFPAVIDVVDHSDAALPKVVRIEDIPSILAARGVAS